jgi:hypothetical protein
MKKARDILKEFEGTGKFVFHGSPYKINTLEPRQPKILDEKEEKLVPDGEISIVASLYFEIALFRAILNRKNIPVNYKSGFGFDEETKRIDLKMSKETFAQLEGKTGYVYVLNKKDFSPRDPNRPKMMEWRAEKKVQPVRVVEVSSQDLSGKITFI